MREMIKRNLDLKYLIPFIANEAIIVLSTLSVIIFLKKKKFRISGINRFIAVILYLFSTVFSITDNNFIKISV